MPLTQRALADALGLSAGTVSKLKRLGMPTTTVSAARAWRRKNLRARIQPAGAGSSSYAVERAGRERAARRLTELRAGQLAGELIPVADVDRRWTAIANDIRTAFMQLAPRMAPLLAGRDQHTIRTTLDREVREVLMRLGPAPK